jgi:mRNA-degrading endonuclease toxin of MazEF toxin-antitoxin module
LAIRHCRACFDLGTTGSARPDGRRLRKGAGGLKTASVAICHQVTTLDRRKLVRRLGKLTSQDLAAIEDGVKAAMDLV